MTKKESNETISNIEIVIQNLADWGKDMQIETVQDPGEGTMGPLCSNTETKASLRGGLCDILVP